MPAAARPIPRSLRAALADVPLPAWIRDAAALPAGASLQALEPSLVESRLRGLGRRLDLYLCGLVRTRMRRLIPVPVVDGPKPTELTIGEIPLSMQTGRLLRDAGLEGDSPLAALTYGALFAVRQLGPRGILEFAAEAERAADHAHRCNGWPRELDELRRRLSGSPWAKLVTR